MCDFAVEFYTSKKKQALMSTEHEKTFTSKLQKLTNTQQSIQGIFFEIIHNFSIVGLGALLHTKIQGDCGCVETGDRQSPWQQNFNLFILGQ